MGHRFDLRVHSHSLTATSVIVLYTLNKQVRYALTHDIDSSGELGVGSPLTSANLASALQEILSTQNSDAGFLPGHVLMSHAGKLVWWKKPCRKKLSVKLGSASYNFEVDLPGLVFSVTADTLKVAAVMGSERPEQDTLCYKPPFFNFYDNGSMCRGTVEYPDGSVLSRIDAWESTVFDTNFTHANSKTMVEYPGGLTKLWQDLKEGVITSVPESAFVPMSARTVLDFCKDKS